MPTYISSNNNRFYVALETSYGNAASVTPQNRIPAVKLTARQQTEKTQRRDKTGTRTFPGDPVGLRSLTNFDITTYMTGWDDQAQAPPHGALFQACLGGAPISSGGGAVASSATPTSIAFTAAHGLAPGAAVVSGNEMRFVTAVVDSKTVLINAPFSAQPQAGGVTTPTMTYIPAEELSSTTIYDYWSPTTAAQRLLSGAAVDKLTVKVNSDLHQFEFSGQASDLVDSTSFQGQQAGLTQYPGEPAVAGLNYSIIPGHLGQVWLGAAPAQFFTLTAADLTLSNGLQLRAQEFGSQYPRAIAPGIRTVALDFTVFQMDDSATAALYQAARQRSPISVMLQLGQEPGQLFGIYMKSIVPQVPQFDDSQSRLQWRFQTNRAQGGVSDELYIAFG